MAGDELDALGVTLRHRDHAQRVQFVTGHDRHGALPADLDVGALADPRATTVVYMGRRTAARLATELMRRGLAPTTPVIVATNVSRADEGSTRTTLQALAGGEGLAVENAPTLVLIGAALDSVEATASQRVSTPARLAAAV